MLCPPAGSTEAAARDVSVGDEADSARDREQGKIFLDRG
jgi:hypothetical protein